MNKFFGFLEKRLLPPLNKVANTKVVRGIMNASLAAVPFTIVASIFLILNNLPTIFPFAATFFQNTLLRFSAFYSIGNTMALGTIAVYYSLAIGYYYIEEYRKAGEEKLNAFTGSVLSLFAFLMTIPSIIWKNGAAVGVSTKVVENTGSVNGLALANGWITRFGGVGIFISIIMGILAVQVYRFCVNRDLTIKMPEGVPAGVSRSFASLIPVVLVAFIVIIIVSILGFLGTDIHALLSVPFGFVKYLTGSWLGMVIILLLIHLLWIVGVHGTAIIKNSFINPILLVALTENINGSHNIFAGDFINMWVFLGGAGGTLGLALLMNFAAKSKQLKILGHTAIIPSIFNINEPIIFGAPIVYNPYLIIPFLVNPIVSASLAYFAIKIGIVGVVNTAIAWVLPVGVGAWLGTGGNIPAVILAFINLAISIAIYYPFFRMYDQKLLAEEKN
ncbi:PTS cellobiose transporter subunit IIC [Lactiplantibacillus plantarum]|uniref:PTS cellobiose transporter subunit IIC n=1 Tax=Lactiplantibacillus plantarum TaxID=1590 RepID=UPI000EB780FE|nr:PTS cellobiose transporter subunit IIC [Lactiplantibacillus plantarum]AYC73298.1 PTS cellobiose transporter subunit IIC [Lactiplantibacillus plantarum]MCW0154729.1 PTS cellobiose transporter subunit IIC [Lactiplantibacillus plantarum]MCW6118628.1 PTS cellobiose transporter subunit IIC [Lactiplantibacillus plantarum]MPQ38693.1 PTS cellobiose transporter subunit IIC [Lactiplantibacillus plantarum]